MGETILRQMESFVAELFLGGGGGAVYLYLFRWGAGAGAGARPIETRCWAITTSHSLFPFVKNGLDPFVKTAWIPCGGRRHAALVASFVGCAGQGTRTQ